MVSILLAIVLSASINAPNQVNRFATTGVQFEQLAEAYGFVSGQQHSLELINRDFPELAGEVNKARLTFESDHLEKDIAAWKRRCLNGYRRQMARIQREDGTRTERRRDRQAGN